MSYSTGAEPALRNGIVLTSYPETDLVRELMMLGRTAHVPDSLQELEQGTDMWYLIAQQSSSILFHWISH